jgi:hypothetical protein
VGISTSDEDHGICADANTKKGKILSNKEIVTKCWEVLASTCPDIYGQSIGPVPEVSVQK